MRINEKLNLVKPIYGDSEDDIIAWAHSMPISREVFDANYLLIAKTFAALHVQGLGDFAGPRVAANVLKDQAKQLARTEEAVASVLHPLLSEIHRLTNVLLPTEQGWETISYDQVLSRKLLSSDDVAEVESAIVFFIVICAMHTRLVARDYMAGAARLWGAQLTSLTVTGWRDSLPTLTVAATTANPIPSSLPS